MKHFTLFILLSTLTLCVSAQDTNSTAGGLDSLTEESVTSDEDSLSSLSVKDHFRLLTPKVNIGGTLGADVGEEKYSFLFAIHGHVGKATDPLNLSMSVGYRAWLDGKAPRDAREHHTALEYLLFRETEHEEYIRSPRSLGGQFVVGAEANLNLIQLPKGAIFAGCAMEYGLRVYQGRHDKRFYGTYLMNRNSLAWSPQVGYCFNEGDGVFAGSIALFARFYTKDLFNGREIPINKFQSDFMVGIKFTFCGGE